MQKQTIRAASVCVLVFALGCSGSATKTSTPTTPTTPTIVINAPTPASPSDGTSAVGWPTLTVNNATHTGPAGPLQYRFDVSTASDFTNIVATAVIQEGSGQTSYTPSVTPLPSDQSTLYWRVVAWDEKNQIQSPASATQSFKENNPPTKAAQIAQQQGRTLWSGTVPPGTPGQAKMGNGWEVLTRVSFDGVTFLSPELDELQWFDCVDRGMAPQAALDWMRSHGYLTQAVFYPDTGSGIPVVGFSHQYIALQGGIWELVTRVGA